MQDVEPFELDVDEPHELLFKVAIEGNVSGTAKVRLVCEADDVSYMFSGHPTTDGLVKFVLPKTPGLKEGTYPSRVEVLVENKYFAPVSFDISFKKAVTVMAEAVRVPSVVKRDDVKVSVAPVVAKPRPEPRPVVIEGPQRAPEAKKAVQPVKVEKRAPEAPKTLAQRYQLRKK